MRHALHLCLLPVLLLSPLQPSIARAATRYAGEFLALGVGARSLGMGGAFVALSADATAGYWNPAGLPKMEGREAMVMHSERFGGTIHYDVLSFAAPVQGLGGVGVNLLRVGVDDIPYTVLEDPKAALSPSNRPRVAQTVSDADYALYLSNGRAIGHGLSVGGTLKLIRRSIGDEGAFGYGIDVGLLYTPAPGLSLGANLRDATTTAILWGRGTTDRIRPSLLLGAAYARPLPFAEGRIVAALSASRGGDAPDADGGSFISAGAEYWYRDQIALRVGSQEGRLTAGAGVQIRRRIGVDFAFLQHEELDNTYRVSASVRF